MNDREKWKEHSDADGGVLVPRLHLDAHFSQVGGDDRAELAAEEAVDEGVHGRVAVADPQDHAAERRRTRITLIIGQAGGDPSS